MQPRMTLLTHFGAALVLALMPACGLAPRSAAASMPAAAAKPKVIIFYPTTDAAYKAWNASTSTTRPKKTTRFACNTNTVGLYFEYANAVPKHTQFQILVYYYTGQYKLNLKTPETRSRAGTANYRSGLAMLEATDKRSFEGPYRAYVMIDGHPAAYADYEVMIDGGEC